MEDKRLNIHQPLLSVRRYSSVTAPQKNDNKKSGNHLPPKPAIESCKTEFKSDPMNTGSVPFVWEHSPGRPKYESNKQVQTKENPFTFSRPNLPPGRISKPTKKDFNNTSEDHDHIQIHTKVTKNHSSLQSIFQKETKKESSESGDGDSDEIFMDALDTLSRAESSFYNCSASGVSGFDSDIKPSGILRADPKLRDFMMGRFLPAAKAMASEVPQHSSRRQAINKNPQEVKKLMKMNHKYPQLRYGPTFLQDAIAHDQEEEEEEEEEDSDYEYEEHGNMSSKFCGLVPRFCSKGFILNPVPGMGMKTKLPVSAPDRIHAISSSTSSIRDIETEPARIGIYEHRSLERSHLPKQQEHKNHNSKLEGSRLYNRLQRKGLTFKELLAVADNNKNETDSEDSVVEKTLYVDTVQVVKPPEEDSVPVSVPVPVPVSVPAPPQESCKTDTPLKYLELVMLDDDSELETKTKMDTDTWKDSNFDDQDTKSCTKDSVFELPPPPPLPKTPSDSWLGRTLPSVSAKPTPIRWINTRVQSSDVISTDTKSDKNTQLQNPKDPLFPIPES